MSQNPIAEVLDYEDGFCKINWENAEKRDYDDSVSKNACMAECLAVSPVKPEDFFTIYIADNNTKDYVEFLATNILGNYKFYIDVNPSISKARI